MGKRKLWGKVLSVMCMVALLCGSLLSSASALEPEDNQEENLPKEVKEEVDRLHELALEKALPQLQQERTNSVRSFAMSAMTRSSLAGTSVQLDRGSRLPYSNYSTFIYNIQDADGETREGFCIEPAKDSPNDGSYQAINAYTIDSEGNGALDIDFLRAAVWFSYGAPGFDRTLFPSQYYDGSSMTANEYRIASHLLVSKVFQNGSTVISTGTSPQFYEWYWNYVTGDHWSAGNFTRLSAWDKLIYDGRYREVPDTFNIYFLYSGNEQLIVFWDYNPTGYARVTKTSASPAITNGNDCYSLAGAQYGIYSDSACRNQVATLTTDASGNTSTVELDEGRYYLKEISAPQGYYLDTNVYTVDITGGQTTNVPVQDVPGNDPAAITLNKIDKESGEVVAQGGASLTGAQFTVNYYDGYYTMETLPDEPTRTWVIETQEITNPATGEIRYRAMLNDSCKVSGDDFYYVSGNPDPTLPLGTITVEETQAPEGYLLENAYLQAIGSEERTEGVYLSQITMEGQLVSLRGGNEYAYNEQVIRGGVKIQKRDIETSEASAQGKATLENATFEIVSMNDRAVLVEGNSYENGEVVKQINTNSQGIAQTSADLLPYGDYRIQEVTPPEGYLTEGAAPVDFSVTTEGQIVDLTGTDESISNRVIRGGVKIQKRDIETSEASAQGKATLESATFEIVSLNDQAVMVEGNLYENGEVVKQISTNSQGVAETVANLLPYGDYRIQEATPPEGYLMEGAAPVDFSVTTEGQIVDLTGTDESIYNQVIRGGVKIQKRDLETKEAAAQGGASLQFTVFEIVSLNDQMVVVEGKPYNNGDVVKRIYTNIQGVAETAADLLPYGDYRIQEADPPEGYLIEGAYPVDFSVREDGQIVDLTGEDNSIYNQIKRGDLEGVKIGSGSHKRLANVPFEIRSKTTGESHIVVTDANGQFSTSADWAPHTQNTNRGESSEDGVWFGTSEPNNNKGALPYDTYEIIERECEANEGYELIPPFEVTIYRDSQTIHLGTLTNESPEVPEPPTLGTTATNEETGGKTLKPGEDQKIVDVVHLEGLTVGTEYQLIGWQMIAEDGEELTDADGSRVENTVTFTAEAEVMDVSVPFTVNASSLGGKNLVTFEELYDLTNPEEPEKVGEHKDIEDEGQTVTVEEPEEPEEPETPGEPERTTAPKTGDQAKAALLAALGISGIVAGAMIWKRRKV